MVKSLPAQGSYALRVPSRSPGSSAAKALAAQGVHVVSCQLSDADTVRASVKGAWAVFAVTNYWCACCFV